MKKLIMFVVLAVGLCSDVLAGEAKDYPQISFVLPGKGDSTVSRDQFVILVVEGPFISHEETPIPGNGVVAYVDNVLKAQGATYIGLHIREGVKYGDVVRALDALRQTTAKSIGVSMVELPVGREP